jgi:hypothetical protein
MFTEAIQGCQLYKLAPNESDNRGIAEDRATRLLDLYLQAIPEEDGTRNDHEDTTQPRGQRRQVPNRGGAFMFPLHVN